MENEEERMEGEEEVAFRGSHSKAAHGSRESLTLIMTLTLLPK